MTGVVDSIDVSIEVYGGVVTDISPADLPHGASPDAQDVQFQIGGVRTRPGVTAAYSIPNVTAINYMKTFQNVNEIPRFLSLDSSGTLRKDATPGGALSVISSGIIPGAFCRSDSLFEKEYFAFGDGQHGLDMPRQYDDTNFDRVSQVGPGAPPAVGDSVTVGHIPAGVHQLTVIFVTRSGYYTRPAPPVKWTANGNLQVNVTGIPIGPPNVIARVLSFTAANQASFYHLGPLGLTLANSNMYIADNTTTSLTVDFSDTILLLGQNDDPLFLQIELPPVAGTIGYSNRLFHWGEQANVQNFDNLTFDGGFGTQGGGGGISPTPGTAGPNAPGSGTNDASFGNLAWTNPGKITINDGVAATATIANPFASITQYLKATGYGFTIPLNATITGIKAIVRAAGTGANITDWSVRLYKAGVLTGSDHANGNVLGGFSNQVYGGSSDLWGSTWTPGDINNANFGVAYSASSISTPPTSTASVDFISVTISYTTPASSGGGGGVIGPLGWTQGASYAGGSSALTSGLTAVFGDAFAIAGDGATPVRGEINQSAATDYLTNPVLLPGKDYGVTFRAASAGGLVAGTLHVNLKSAAGGYTTSGLSVQAGQVGATYKRFTGVLTSALGTIPSDLLLQVYADGTPNNGGVFLIDNIEIYPLNPQFNGSIIRASKGQLDTQGQESYDSETGLIEYNLNDGQSVRTCFKIRERLYIVKEHSFGVTQDDGVNEPSLWTVDDVSKTVGTPSVNGVGIGEDWVVIAHRTGLYLYWGGEPVKISQEIQPTWDRINWTYGHTIAVTVDTRHRRIYICAPFLQNSFFGELVTIPNLTMVLDYHDVGSDAAAIAANPPIHLTYTGNKKAFDRARKWCPWTIPANSIAQIEQADGTTAIYFGSNDSRGRINVLDDTNTVFTDNGGTIPSYYFTAAFSELQTEEAKQLRSHRHLYSYLTFYAQGSGLLGITSYPNSISNGFLLNPQALVATSLQDTEMMLNISAERVFFRFSSSGNGQFFDLQRTCVSIRPDPWAIVRGVN